MKKPKYQDQPPKQNYYDEGDEIVNREEKQAMRRSTVPMDSLELQYKETEPAYGKEAHPELYDRITAMKGKAQPLFNPDGSKQLDEHGRQKYAIEVKHLWDELAYLTRDLRLGNLKNSDLPYCEHYLKIAGDCLAGGYMRSFMTAYRYCANRLELSQSRNGFFRKNRNTFRTTRENIEKEDKKKWFGSKGED